MSHLLIRKKEYSSVVLDKTDLALSKFLATLLTFFWKAIAMYFEINKEYRFLIIKDFDYQKSIGWKSELLSLFEIDKNNEASV